MDKTEITTLLLASYKRLEKYARRLALSDDRAEDLLQETTFKILYNADKFEGNDKFIFWAKTIMRNTFINSIKYDAHYQAVDELYYTVTTSSDYCYSDIDINIEDINKAIDNLPGNASTFMRMLINGHKYVEISSKLEIPLGTVKTRINQSRTILKKQLKDYSN